MDIRFRRTIYNYTSKHVLFEGVCMLRKRAFREFEVVTLRHYLTPMSVIPANEAKDFEEKSEAIYVVDYKTALDVLNTDISVESVYILDEDFKEDKANDWYVGNVLKKIGTWTRVKAKLKSILLLFKAKQSIDDVLVGDSTFEEV